MSSNMIDYLRKYGQYTFAEKEFNSVDSLVLSQFAYLKFRNLTAAVVMHAVFNTISFLGAISLPEM